MKYCEKCKTQFDETKLSKWASGKFCSRICANSRVWDQNHKNKISKKMKGYKVGNADVSNPNRKWGVVNRSKIKYTKNCVTCKKDFITIGWSKRKTCSSECMRHAPGRNGGYRVNSTRKIRCEYKGFWMDSGSELQFAQLMDENNIKWKKNTTIFFNYTDASGKARKYYPDFYLPDYDYWVEIKGLYYKHENDKLKLNAVGTNIEIQYHNDIKMPKCI